MSEEQLKAFIVKVQADASLQEQLKGEGSDPVAIAKAAGFAITTEDLNTHRQSLSDGHRQYLSDDELEELPWRWRHWVYWRHWVLHNNLLPDKKRPA